MPAVVIVTVEPSTVTPSPSAVAVEPSSVTVTAPSVDHSSSLTVVEFALAARTSVATSPVVRSAVVTVVLAAVLALTAPASSTVDEHPARRSPPTRTVLRMAGVSLVRFMVGLLGCCRGVRAVRGGDVTIRSPRPLTAL